MPFATASTYEALAKLTLEQEEILWEYKKKWDDIYRAKPECNEVLVQSCINYLYDLCKMDLPDGFYFCNSIEEGTELLLSLIIEDGALPEEMTEEERKKALKICRKKMTRPDCEVALHKLDFLLSESPYYIKMWSVLVNLGRSCTHFAMHNKYAIVVKRT